MWWSFSVVGSGVMTIPPFLRCCIESFISGNISLKVRSICCLLSVVFMLSMIIGVGVR